MGLVRLAFLGACLAVSSGCVWLPLNRSHRDAPTYRVSAVHEVEEGETLEEIAQEFGVSPTELAEYNRLPSLAPPAVGSELRVPPRFLPRELVRQSWLNAKQRAGSLADVARVLGQQARPTNVQVAPKSGRDLGPLPFSRRTRRPQQPTSFVSSPADPVLVTNNLEYSVRPGRFGLMRPVDGSLSRGFSATHAGIDICAMPGTPIHAAHDGRVLYSGNRLRNFGNVIIIERDDGLATLYAHNSVNYVRAGQVVQRGDLIAQVGQTGNATTPHCHFEVRRNGHATDPLSWLR